MTTLTEQSQLTLEERQPIYFMYMRLAEDATFGTRLRAAWGWLTTPLMLIWKGRSFRVRIERKKS